MLINYINKEDDDNIHKKRSNMIMNRQLGKVSYIQWPKKQQHTSKTNNTFPNLQYGLDDKPKK